MNGQSDPKVLVSTAQDFELDPASGESHGRFLCVVVEWVSVPKRLNQRVDFDVYAHTKAHASL